MNSHAVVVGGGIGGLLAAYALSGSYERVTVLERHRYATDFNSRAPAARRGVPQSRCLHLLMAAGVAAFDELIPGWRTALVARGAVPFDASADAAMWCSSGWLMRSPSDITCYACSRALLENVLRGGLAHDTTVQVCEGQGVVGLVSDRLGARVTGVRLGGRSNSTTVGADLVVDASGRGSALPEWLDSLPGSSRAPIEETIVASGLEYVSRWFHLAPDDAPDWHCLSIAPAAGAHPRSGMMLRAERDLWGVVLLAPTGEALPADDQAFLDFTDAMADGKLRDALTRATPVSPIHRYGSTPNRLRHFERQTSWPAGLVALGESVCALDPYFGLGMTATARGVVLLRSWLKGEGGRAPDAFQFQQLLAALNGQPWRLASGCDPDGRPLARNAGRLDRVYTSAVSSPEIAHALLAVHHLLRPEESLMELATT
jgi:2-polyprenyl-6-methoxyphenol hydroxylase-like FAD-dependent oxidoreductase